MEVKALPRASGHSQINLSSEEHQLGLPGPARSLALIGREVGSMTTALIWPFSGSLKSLLTRQLQAAGVHLRNSSKYRRRREAGAARRGLLLGSSLTPILAVDPILPQEAVKASALHLAARCSPLHALATQGCLPTLLPVHMLLCLPRG